MKFRIKFLYGILFSLFACLLFVGYAALTDSLDLTGLFTGTSQDNVFVADITVNNDQLSKVSIDGFYDKEINHNINLHPLDETYYVVKLYNNSNNKWFFTGFDENSIPNGVTVKIEELVSYENIASATDNVISSLIEENSYDYFKISFTNNTNEEVNINNKLELFYEELTNHRKIVLEYNGVKYVKYSKQLLGDLFDSVVFDQISIDLSDNMKNVVARCNNGGIISEIKENDKTHLMISNISNYSGSSIGELDVKAQVFDSLTEAALFNNGEFKNDTTPNNFIILQNINENIESKTDSIVVNNDKNYSINLNSKKVIIHKTIKNESLLRIYDESSSKGTLYREYLVSENLKDYTEKYGVQAIERCDLLQNIYPNSKLYVENVNLELIQIDEVDTRKAHREYPAVIVGFEGLVHVLRSNLYTNNGYGVYKKSYYAGDYVNRLLNPTRNESKILVEESIITSERNNCVRFSDGKGIISLVDTTVSSCRNIDYYTEGWYKTDPIFASRHILEGENNSSLYSTYARFYRYATTDVKIYITGGTVISNSNDHVNHFYSDTDINARVYYTSSVKFKAVNSSNELEDTTIHAKTDDDSFWDNDNNMPYPSAMLNGNGATQEELFNSDGTLNRNHYLNNDGWYYIRTGFTGKTSNYSYQSYEYINNAIEEGDFNYLTHNGERVRVGDSFEMINLNNPGEYYVDIKTYTNADDLNYYIPLKGISSSADTQADRVGYDYEFTFLASCDEYYFNIVTLGNLYGVFHVENKGTTNGFDNRNSYNVGIKYINTRYDQLSFSVSMDEQAQRFTLMQYSDHMNSSGVYPYVFVSQYESVISYLDKQSDSSFYKGGQATEDPNIVSHTNPGFMGSNYANGKYLLSNATSPTYVRNGWYLWQDEIAINLSYDLTNKTGITQGSFVQLDSNTKIFISNQSTVTSEGIKLNSNYTNDLHCINCGYTVSSQGNFNDVYNSTETSIACKSCETINTIDKKIKYNPNDDYGYIRITSERELYGIRFVMTNDLLNSSAISTTPWLLIRTYNSQSSTNDKGETFNQSLIQYDILRATVQKNDGTDISLQDMNFGIYRPLDINGNILWDYDENRLTGTPYYIIFEQSTSDVEFVITVYFDAKYANWDLHSITLDPFDDRGDDNSVIIKSITLIEPIDSK